MPNSQCVIPLSLGMVKAFLLPAVDGRAILVDTGMANTASRLQRQIMSQGYGPTAISLILLTHLHVDHTGGVPAIKAWTQAPIAMGRLDAEAARSGQQPTVHGVTALGKLVQPIMGRAEAPRLETDLLIDEELDLALYGIAGRVLHTPGHSPGSLSVWLEGGEVVVGDLVMGRTLAPSRPWYPFIAHNLQQLEQSIASVMDLQPRRIHAAHGGPFTPEAMRRAFPWLAAMATAANDSTTGAGGIGDDR
jgi:hydroxyacylglutathione hydrolase